MSDAEKKIVAIPPAIDCVNYSLPESAQNTLSRFQRLLVLNGAFKTEKLLYIVEVSSYN